jgi:hypothetical protein
MIPISALWAVLGAALPAAGRHRVSWALQWDDIHAALPWQRVRRRWAAARRARARAHASAPPATPEDLSWAWWLQRRELYKPALTAAGAW